MCVCACRGECVCLCVCVYARARNIVGISVFHCFSFHPTKSTAQSKDRSLSFIYLSFNAVVFCFGAREFHLIIFKSVSLTRLNGLPLKPGVGQYISIHATLTSKDFVLAYFYPSGPFTCIFPKPLPIFFCVVCG